MSGRMNSVRQEAKLVETEIDPGGLSPNPPNSPSRVNDIPIVHHVEVAESGALGNEANPIIRILAKDDIGILSDSDDGSDFPRTDTLESTEDKPTPAVPVTVSVGLKIHKLKTFDAIHVISVLIHSFIYYLTPSELLHANDWPLWRTIMTVGPLISASGALIKAFTVVPFSDDTKTDKFEDLHGGIVGVDATSRLPSIFFSKGVHYLVGSLLALGPVISNAGLLLAYDSPVSLTVCISGAFLAAIVIGASGVGFKNSEAGPILPKLSLYRHHRSANKSRRGRELPEGGNER